MNITIIAFLGFAAICVIGFVVFACVAITH